MLGKRFFFFFSEKACVLQELRMNTPASPGERNGKAKDLNKFRLPTSKSGRPQPYSIVEAPAHAPSRESC